MVQYSKGEPEVEHANPETVFPPCGKSTAQGGGRRSSAPRYEYTDIDADTPSVYSELQPWERRLSRLPCGVERAIRWRTYLEVGVVLDVVEVAQRRAVVELVQHHYLRARSQAQLPPVFETRHAWRRRWTPVVIRECLDVYRKRGTRSCGSTGLLRV
jgi:hypothetical protein